jgi:hypothetical protein
MVEFKDWTNQRSPAHLSTNSYSEVIAFQGWRNFKEAYAPELVEKAYRETSLALGRPVRTCVDPFGGSGTTALACQFLGVDVTTIEVNPFLADLIEAKLSRYDVDKLAKGLGKVLSKERPPTRKELLAYLKHCPKTFLQPGVEGRYLFSREVAAEIALLYMRISRIRDSNAKRLFKVLLTSITVDLSNVVVSGKGRRYRKNWEAREVTHKTVREEFEKTVLAAIYDIQRYANRVSKQYNLLRGDSRQRIKEINTVDLAVFSPPYPNSFDYTDVYNVELWIGGYFKSDHDNRALRTDTLRSHVQIKRAYEQKLEGSKLLEKTVEKLRLNADHLWNRSIPDMVISYFADMLALMNDIANSLVVGGRMYVVIGNSMYAGIEVDVGRILEQLAPRANLTFLSRTPFRSMRSSPQQGGKKELEESLLIFTR